MHLPGKLRLHAGCTPNSANRQEWQNTALLCQLPHCCPHACAAQGAVLLGSITRPLLSAPQHCGRLRLRQAQLGTASRRESGFAALDALEPAHIHTSTHGADTYTPKQAHRAAFTTPRLPSQPSPEQEPARHAHTYAHMT